MTITINAASKARGLTSLASSGSFALDAGAGSNRLLVAILIVRGSADTITGVTYNSVALTQAVAGAHSSVNLRAEIWYLIAPATGSNTLAFTASGGTGQVEMMGVVFEGVDQTAPLDDFDEAEGNSTAPSVTSTPTTNNQLIVAGVVHEAVAALTVDGGETSLWDTDQGAWVTSASYAIQTTATAQAMNWTAGGSDNWQAAAASFKEQASGGSPVTVTPDPASCVASTTAPGVVLGPIMFTPAPATCVAGVTAPGVVLGAVTIVGLIASVIARVVNPQVLDGTESDGLRRVWERLMFRRRGQ